jgi:2-keto-3-deoxy-L-rhamnonate aldolase RhmA
LKLKEKLLKKELSIGSWLSFGFTPTVEIMAKAGFEWLVIDMEHNAINDFDMMQMIQIISLAGSIPLVRVGKNDDLLIKKAMDAGSYGVIVPMVNTRDDAAKAVSYVKYPPTGLSGAGLSRAQQYGMGFQEYKSWVENDSIVIVQIEHIKAIENLSEIMSVQGVDGFIIGPYDLSASMGLPGDFSNQRVEEALKTARLFMEGSSKPGGYHIVHSNPLQLEAKINEGYRFIAYGDDMVFFSEKIASEEKIFKKYIK